MQQLNVNNTSNNNNNNVERKPHITKSKSTASSAVSRKLKDTVKNMTDRKSRDDGGSKSNCHHHHYKHMISHYNCEKAAEKMIQQMNNGNNNNNNNNGGNNSNSQQQNVPNLNISLEYRIKTDENGEKSIIDESSNLFLYLDMHGHASKKGKLLLSYLIYVLLDIQFDI